MAKRKIENSRAIVTGASGGIGRAMAMELARRGAKLIVTARREDRLDSLVDEITAGGGVAHSVVGDITLEETRRQCLNLATKQLGGLDILVNNAGIGALGPFADADPARLRQVMEVNFFAPAEFIREAFELLQSGNKPIIVNVNSVLGHRAVPGKSEYCASKFALHGLSDALRAELAGQGVDVLLISPSTTDSEFFDNVIDRQGKPMKENPVSMSPQRVARIAVRAIASGRHEVLISLGGKALVWVDRLMPWLADRLVARFG